VGEDGLKITTQLSNNTYETGEWLNDFNEVTRTALKKKPKATKCSNHHTISKYGFLHGCNFIWVYCSRSSAAL
jgi:hypothetical protein